MKCLTHDSRGEVLFTKTDLEMEETKGFYDLCIPYNKNEEVMRSLLTELSDLGYRTVAVEQIFDHSKKEATKRGSDIFPNPHNLNRLREEFHDKIQILQRLTVIYTDIAVSHAMMNSMNLKKFNIIAGHPKSDAALMHCCTTFIGDIVTFDPDIFKPLVTRKNYQVAVKRGIFFEIKYSPVITNSTCRKDTIKIAHNYAHKGKSKNIILSSGATNIFELRGPYDVSNLALIFGLSEDKGRSSVSNMCRQLILRAESRRLGKTIMFVRNVGLVCFSSSSEEDETDLSNDENDFFGKTSSGIRKNGCRTFEELNCDEDTNELPNKKKKT